MKVRLQNAATSHQLTRRDFIAQGGEGAVYAKGDTAFKVYTDPDRMIPLAKIDQLARLDSPAMIRPDDILLPARGRAPIGYTMRFVRDTWSLVQLFPRAFKQRHGIAPETVRELVARIEAGVRHVHAHDMLIVDLNEMNVLVGQNLQDVWFIDVDSYQTRGYPATAIMESVRDRHAARFSEGTDWFAFAVVTFQLWIGIHPYRGRHPDLPDMDARMRANASVFNADVRYPKGPTLPFDVIPPRLRDWYEATFDRGLRDAPPAGLPGVAVRAAVPAGGGSQPVPSGALQLERLLEAGADILAVFAAGARDDHLAVLTHAGALIRNRFRPCEPDAQIVWTARKSIPVAAVVRDGELRLRDLDSDRPLPFDCAADSVMAIGGRLLAHSGDRIVEIDLLESGRHLLASARPVGNSHPRTTRAFRGCFIQTLLDTTYASLFPAAGGCHQLPLPELAGYRVVDAACDGRVLMVVGVTPAGRYDRFVVRFTPDFGTRDVRRVEDIAYAGLDFVTLDKGVVVSLDETDRLELFPAAPGADAVSTIDDAALAGAGQLHRQGDRVLLSRGGVLYRATVNRQPGNARNASGPL